MCGRYTLYHDEADLTALFELETFPAVTRFNIAPTQDVPIVRQQRNGVREVLMARWGLVPHWVKDLGSFKANLFNARSEGAAEKNSFRDAMKRSRCLVPASGFYEWKAVEEGKQPYFIHRSDGRPMGIAGLYSVWTRGGTPLLSCTILTTSPNAELKPLHDRMPVILEADEFERWLAPDIEDPEVVEDLMDPFENGLLEAYPVGRAVGNARAEGPDLIHRVDA